MDSDINSSTTTVDLACAWASSGTVGGWLVNSTNWYPTVQIGSEKLYVTTFAVNSPTTGKTRLTVQRRQRGTIAAAHTAGDTVIDDTWYWHPSHGGRNFGGWYVYQVYGGLGMAAGIGYPETDAYTRRRAHDWIRRNVPWWNYAGPNATNCYGKASECDNWQWLFEPRDKVGNVTVSVATGSVTLKWTVPGGVGCRVGLAQGGFQSSSDATDEAAAPAGRAQSYTATELVPGEYAWRVTCGTARVRGVVAVP